MLWYKAWLETRSRFLIALVGCVAFCVRLVLILPRGGQPNESFLMLYGVHQGLVFVWILGVTLLMMGGLLRENAIGSSSFTLSLPVSRSRLTLVRTGMALVQATLLAIVPWISMLLTLNIAGRAHAIPQAGFHIFLLLGGGVVFLAASLLISSLVEGEYTAPIVTFGVIIMLVYALSGKKLIPYSPWAFMMGFGYIDRERPFLVGPVPWFHAAAFAVIAALLTMIAIRVIQQRDF